MLRFARSLPLAIVFALSACAGPCASGPSAPPPPPTPAVTGEGAVDRMLADSLAAPFTDAGEAALLRLSPEHKRAARDMYLAKLALDPFDVQVRAKDGLVALHQGLTVAERTELERKVVAWYRVDYAARLDAGRYKADEVLVRLAPATHALAVELISRNVEPFRVVAAVTAMADPKLREVVGKLLWQRASQSPIEPDAAAVAVGAKLLDPAFDTHALTAAVSPERSLQFRVGVLNLLAQGERPWIREGVRTILDQPPPPEVRIAAARALIANAGPDDYTRLQGFLTEKELQPAALAAAVRIADAANLERLLDGVTPQPGWSFADWQTLTLACERLGPAVLPVLQKLTQSTKPAWQRALALLCIGKLGTPLQKPFVESLVGDEAKLQGLEDVGAVGEIAKRVLLIIEKR